MSTTHNPVDYTLTLKDLIADDPFDRRFPGLACNLYIAYRYGFKSVARELLDRIAEEADSGTLDHFIQDWQNG